MVNKEEKKRRAKCLRKWYFSRSDNTERAICRRALKNRLGVREKCFYNMLEGITFISDERAQVINTVANRGVFPEMWLDIFAATQQEKSC